MKSAGDFLQRVTAVEAFPQKEFFRVEQEIALLTQTLEDVVPRAVGAERLRCKLPFGLRQPLGFERPINVIAVDFDEVKSLVIGGARQQFELGRIGHGACQVDLRPNKGRSAFGEYPVASRPQRIASRACSLVARILSMKTITSR